MADSGIERTTNIPDVPDFGETDNDLRAALKNHLTILNTSIAAMYDTISERINLSIVFLEYGDAIPPQVTGDQANYALPDGIVIKIDTDAARTINGFVAPLVKRFVIILNNGAFNISLPHQSNTADPANRLSTSTGGTVTLTPTQSTSFWYDPAISRWRQLV